MANELAKKQTPKFSVAIKSEAYQRLINDTLGDKKVAQTFVAEISTVVAQNPQLQECDAVTILSAGLMAQTLKLPLSPTLGFAYILPFKNMITGISRATFQIGYKGLIQLAQRSGQFERLGVREVHEGEYIGQDEFGDDLFKFSHEFDNKPVVGYFAYFQLLNGFRKTMYWTVDQCKNHAKKYSRSYGNNKGTDLWSTNFDLMAEKTVLKLLLNRYAPLSVDLQKAFQSDQAVIKEDGTYEYVDNSDNEEYEKLKTTVNNSIIPEDETEGIDASESKEKLSKKVEKAEKLGIPEEFASLIEGE